MVKLSALWLIGVCAVLAAAAPLAQGGSIIGSFDWDDGTLQEWSSDESWVTLSNPGSGGVDDTGYLRIALPDATGFLPPERWFALATAPASSLFAGSWTSDMWIEFDFWAEDVEPEYVQVRFAGDDGTEWRNTVFDSDTSTMRTQTWTQLTSAQFDSYTDWDYGGGSQEDFVNDLASIDWIGVYIWRNTSAAQDYGIDNFRLMVPEPAESVMLLACTATVVLSLRRKRRSAARGQTEHPLFWA